MTGKYRPEEYAVETPGTVVMGLGGKQDDTPTDEFSYNSREPMAEMQGWVFWAFSIMDESIANVRRVGDAKPVKVSSPTKVSAGTPFTVRVSLGDTAGTCSPLKYRVVTYNLSLENESETGEVDTKKKSGLAFKVVPGSENAPYVFHISVEGLGQGDSFGMVQ
jgi:hypothetical protein